MCGTATGRASGVLAALLCGALAASGPAAPAALQRGEDAIRAAVAEFPPADRWLAETWRRGAENHLADRLLAARPDAEATLELLARLERTEEALEALERAVNGPPERLAGAIEVAMRERYGFVGDSARGHAERFRALLQRARNRTPELPPEEAAALLRAVVPHLVRAEEPARFVEVMRGALRGIVDEHPDTAAAVHVEIDLAREQRDWKVMFERLDRLVERHRGTALGAAALYAKAEYLQFNAIGDLEPRGSDPLRRFTLLIAAVDELVGGSFPPCRWVDEAPQLVFEFYISRDTTVPAESLGHIIGQTERLLIEHFELDPEQPGELGVGGAVGNNLYRLYVRRGDPLDGFERLFARLEEAHDPDAVGYLRALVYLKRAREAVDADETGGELVETGADWLERAVAGLEALAERPGRYGRRALATLATTWLHEGELERAERVYRSYLEAHPGTAWSWVAVLRIGQIRQLLGDREGASRAYLRAARSADFPAPAHVLGWLFEGHALLTDGRVAEAVSAYRSARQAWDPAYGDSLNLLADIERGASGLWPMNRPQYGTSPQELDDRVVRLERSLALAEGGRLEQARWLLELERREEAERLLLEVLASQPSEMESDARTLLHRSRLERALDLADVEREDRDEAAALQMLTELARQPWDPAVGVAKLALAVLRPEPDNPSDAGAPIEAALEEWHRHRAPPANTPAVDAALLADLRAIRTLLFLPTGGPIYQERWNAFDFPPQPPRYVAADPVVSVTLASGRRRDVSVGYPANTHDVLFLTDADRALLERLLTRLGGTNTRRPRYVMETPNQPIGRVLGIAESWNRFFPVRPGHWAGWILLTYPIVGDVEFLDEERTRAAVSVTLGYSGARVHLQKRDGQWRATGLGDRVIW